MKIEASQSTPGYKPKSITITVETKEEEEIVRHFFSCARFSDRMSPGGDYCALASEMPALSGKLVAAIHYKWGIL